MSENRYFDYLCCLVGRSQEYSILLDELHRIQYYSLIPNDDNRGVDGEYVREGYLEETRNTGKGYLPKGGATVLEMLIGLSYRLEFESLESRWEKRPAEWFWILIDNLGLTDCTNDAITKTCEKSRSDITNTIDVMLSREYDGDGNGGLFPLKNPKKDQRRVEIWYQMNAYIIENYY